MHFPHPSVIEADFITVVARGQDTPILVVELTAQNFFFRPLDQGWVLLARVPNPQGLVRTDRCENVFHVGCCRRGDHVDGPGVRPELGCAGWQQLSAIWEEPNDSIFGACQ